MNHAPVLTNYGVDDLMFMRLKEQLTDHGLDPAPDDDRLYRGMGVEALLAHNAQKRELHVKLLDMHADMTAGQASGWVHDALTSALAT